MLARRNAQGDPAFGAKHLSIAALGTPNDPGTTFTDSLPDALSCCGLPWKGHNRQ